MSTNTTNSDGDDDMPHPFCELSEFRVPDGEELRQLRLLCGLTLDEVAEEVGCNRRSITRWEQGQRTPDIDAAQSLLDCYREHAEGQTRLGRS